MPRPYPVDAEGMALKAVEMGYPESGLDLGNPYSFENDHLQFTRRSYVAHAIAPVLFGTLRNLNERQEPLPIDVHDFKHARYSAPQFPTHQQAMDRIDRAFQEREKLRFGSHRNPSYIVMSRDRYLRCLGEYTLMNRMTA